jgi:signal transduction histidine kinase
VLNRNPSPAPPTTDLASWPYGVDEVRLQAILSKFSGATMGVFYAFRRDPDGRMTVPFMAPSLATVFGAFNGADPSRDTTELFARVHPDDRGPLMAAIAGSATTLAPFQSDFRVLHPERGEIWLAARSTPSRQTDGSTLWFGHALDITERVSLEARYAQAQRLEAMGRLAGGIAHDFNNLLTVIIGNSDMLLASTASDHPDRRFLEDILQAARRAASLTERLLTFTRRNVGKPEVLRLSDLVRTLEPVLARLLREDIRLALDLGAGATRVRVDPGQIELLLVNLVANARDAMPAGGSLTISTADAPGEVVHLRFPELPPRPFVELAVRDTGCGMTGDVKARAFEPFFTTKPWGQGTGLGLPTVFGIVKACGGAIDVETAEGTGSTFRVFLPAIDHASAPSPAGARTGAPDTPRR